NKSGLDLDGNGHKVRVRLFQSADRLLVRWDFNEGSHANQGTWAIAEHIVITLSPDADPSRIEKVLQNLPGFNRLPPVIRASLTLHPLRLRSRTYGFGFVPDRALLAVQSFLPFGMKFLGLVSPRGLSKATNLADLLWSLPLIRKIPGIVHAEPDYLI